MLLKVLWTFKTELENPRLEYASDSHLKAFDVSFHGGIEVIG
jgi:hypothetical protein